MLKREPPPQGPDGPILPKAGGWQAHMWLRRAGPPCFLAALTVAFFWRLLFLGQSLGGLDALEYFYPYRAYASTAIHEGRLPLWNPLIFGGVPFLANIQTALFYPFTGLFYILSATSAYTWSILVQVFLGAYFAYLFARFSLRLHQTPSLLVALVFGFGGFMGAQLGHLNQFSAAIWLPALLLCWDRATTGRRPLFLLLGALTTALMILAGHPQEVYLALCTLLLYALCHTLWRLTEQGPRVLAVNAGATALILAVGALLSAVQLLPTAELTSWSIRSGGLPYALATTFSLKGSMLFNALLPPFWNRDLLLTVPGGSEFMGYVSVIGLLLALAGVLYRRSRHTAFFCLLALFSLSLALGKQNPLFPAFYRFVPGFSSLRVPARWLFPYTLSLGALAGLGAEALLHERRRLNWRPFVLLLALLAIGGALLARLEVHPPLATVATWLAFAALALVLILGAMQPRAWRAPWGGLFAAALIVELWLGGQSLDYSHPVPSAVFSEQLPTLSFLERQPGPFRAVSVASDTFVPSIEAAFRQAHPNLSQEQTFNYLSYYKLREILEPNTSLAQGIATIDGYDGGLLPLARYVNFKNLLAGQPSDPDERLRFVIKWLPSRPLLDLANVRYVVMDSLSDKSDGSTVYDLSSFIHVDPSQPRATLQLAQPFAASSLGFVLALKGGDLPEGSTLATLTLHGANGSTQTVPVTEGSLRPFSTLPGPDKLPTLVGTASLPTPTTVQAVDVTLKAQGEEFYLNGLALISPGGVSLSPLVAPGGAFQRVFRGDVKIYRDEATLGAAFLVHNGQLAASPQAALAAISAPTFDPRRSVAIEANPQPPASGNLVGRILSRLRRLLPAAIGTPLPHSWFASPAPATNDTPDAVTVHEDSPERWSVSTRSGQAGFLVLSQSWFPGWTATVDGEPARLLAADELFQGVHLPAGAHQVTFTFAPESVAAGAVISLATLFLWLLALALLLLSPRLPQLRPRWLSSGGAHD